MDDIQLLILKIKVDTKEVKTEHLQEVLKKFKAKRNTQEYEDTFERHCSEILQLLWIHMERGFEEFEDQLLCSTCFYTILNVSCEKEHYLKLISKIFEHALNFKETELEASTNTSRTISLMYGIFQSSILMCKSKDMILASILNQIFSLLLIMAYEYSQYTFIVFKIMTLFKKVVDTDYESIIFNKNCNFKLLNVINHNWENPITGVRSLNKLIFENMISVMDKESHEFILRGLKGFYWNKAKYLMFSVIIEKYSGNIKTLITEYDFVEGLIHSLHKAGLVSAGADMYITIVKKLSTENEWSAIFLNVVIEIINGVSIKAVENFFNYWCQNTLKTFPLLMETIFEEVEKLNCAKYKLYSCLSLILHGSKLGLEKNVQYSSIEKCVFNGIEHIDANIRELSFDILCGTKNKLLRSCKKYDLILDFLRNNVNSDCSLLRINMIDSFQKFLMIENSMFINYSQSGKDYIPTDLEDFLSFCMELQKFIIESLNFDGNYQRKVATIQVTKVLLNSLKGVSSKKQRRPNTPSKTLMDFLISKNYWTLGDEYFVMKLINLLKDPSDDIREYVIDVLLNNYSDLLCKKHFMDYLTQEALLLIQSKFFYQITCGQVMFKLVVHLLLMKNCTEGEFKKVEDLFEFAHNVLKSECNSKIDIVKSINEGKQLHSYLSILYCIFEVCLVKSHKLSISLDQITSLLDMLKNISNQFAWEAENESLVSSDFSKMNDMVQDMIANSEHQICNLDSGTKLSGLQQLVLNCIWLNVKASCQLSSILVKYYKNDDNIDVCEKCLKIICNVLETSRHKGAIEAGGTTLGQAIQQLTSLPEESNISKIPINLLKCKLNELISETSNMSSVTRRGAGLSIMIHRIVSSDMKKGKPLFHFFMKVLLETLKKLSDISEENELKNTNEKDMPKAIYIHFLTRIVIDSGLASVMMYYSAKLAEIAFDNLTSCCWQIRNAALQLYGALIPKLIGQKKKSGAGEEVMATVAVDEFRTHSPKLWVYIVKQLKDSTKSSNVVQIHNNLVPILSIFANMAPMYSFAYEKEINEELLPGFLSLIGSPIYVVRRLTAKCILNVYPYEAVIEILLNSECTMENSLHGTLMLLSDFMKLYNGKKDLKEKCENLKLKYQNIMNTKNHSYLCKERFECIFPENINMTDNMMKETLSEVSGNGKKYAQGIFLWVNLHIQKYFKNASWHRIPGTVALIVDCSDFELYCEVLCQRIENEENIPEKMLLEIFNTLFSLGFKKKSAIIWKTLYKISLKVDLLNMQLDSSLLYRYLIDNELSYRTRYMLPLAARLFKNSEAKRLSKNIYKLCSPEFADVDMRLTATIANNELARKFFTLTDDTKCSAIKAAIVLLQDEDEDVRNCSVHFYRLVIREETETHPYICLQKILSNDFLNVVCGISPSETSSMCIDLMDLVKSLTAYNEEEYNPFANESKNIYLEPDVLKRKLELLVEMK